MAIFRGPAYDAYTQALNEAEFAPTTFDYNLAANEAAGNFLQDRGAEIFGDNPITRGLGEVATYGAVPFAFLASPFHEAAQVVAEDKLKDYALPYSGDFANFTKAMLDQRVPQTMAERAGGVLQSTNLGKGIFDVAGKTADLVRGIRQNSPGVRGTSYFDDIDISQPPGTNVGIMGNLRNLFSSSAMANEPMVNVDNVKSAINAARNREELNRIGSLALDDAGLTMSPYEEFAEVNKPGFNFNRARNFLTDVKDKGLDFLGSGKNLALRGIGSMIGGPIGGFIGGALGNLKESPTDKFNLEIGREFGDPYGYKSQLTSGTLGSRQDPFGRNLVSGFSNYEKNRMKEVARLSALQNLNKFQKAKLDFGKKYLEQLETKRQAAIQEMQDRNRAAGTGGYQAGYGSDFMEGPSGAGSGMGSADKGGSDTMGSS